MAVNKLQLKRSAVAGKEPTTSSLALGELAINTYEGRVYLKKDNGVETIVQLADVSGSIFSASYAQTSSHSNNFTVTGPVNVYGSQYISGSLVVGNDITARRLVVQTITSSVIYSSGSNIFGDALTDTQQFTGSVEITGSLTVKGTIGNFTGSTGHIPKFYDPNNLDNSAMYQVGSASIAINQDNVTTAAPEALYVWQPSTTSFNVISGKGNLDNYLQLNIQNTNQGVSASSDVVATANNGNETTNYIDMGINSENFTGPIGDANDAYLYSTGQNLHIGNTTAGKHLGFFVGGYNHETDKKLQLNPTGHHQMTGSLDIDSQVTASRFITRGATAAQFVKGDGSLDSTLYTSASVFNNTTSSLQAFSASMLSFTASTLVNSASFDTRIKYLSSSFEANTASFNAYSASMNAFSASILSTTASINAFSSSTLNFTASTLVNSASFDTRIKYVSSSFEAYTASINNFSSSILNFTASTLVNSASFDTRIRYISSSFEAATASLNAYSASMNAFSASILSTTASINSFSSSVLNFTASTLVNSASFDTRVKYISSSFEAATASLNAFSSSMLSTTASLNLFSASMLSFTASQRNSNGTFATTGSNVFRGNQTITGSLSVSGSTNIFGTTNLTGSVNVSGSTGTAITANVDTIVFTGSYAQSGSVNLSSSVDIVGSLVVNGRNYINDSSSFDTRINYLSSSFNSSTASINAFTASVNAFSASMLATTASMNAFSSSVLNFTASTLVNSASFDTRIRYVSSSFEAATASLNNFSASILSYTASTNATIADILIETASLQAFSASMLSFTASTLVNSSSFDTRINYLSSSFEANTASINLFTASFNAFSSSILNTTASLNAFSASMLSFTASQKDANGTFATTGSNVFKGNQIISGSTSITGSLSLTGSQNIIGNLTVTDTITAQRLVVQFITSSTAQITGSTKFGDEVTDTHQFTGSVLVSGSLVVNGRDYITDSGSFDTRINYISSSFEAATASLNLFSASMLSTTASLNSFSSSILNFTASTLTNSASFDTRIKYISSSFEAATASLNAFSASILSYTASNNAAIADILIETASLNAATASLYNFSSSILNYTASNNEVIAKLYSETASLNAFSASVLSFTASTLINSASFDTRIKYVSSSFEAATASLNAFSASILNTTASINNFSASVLNFTASTLTNSASFDTRIRYVSSSFEAATASFNAFSSSILSYTSSNNAAIADILLETASLQGATGSLFNFSASILSYTASNNAAIADILAETASLNAATASLNLFSASILSFTSSTLINSASFDTRIRYVSSSFEAHTASFNNFSSSILSYTASNNAAITDILLETASLNAATASLNLFSASILNFTASQKDANGIFATTGSNIFRGNQTVTGSLFTSGSNTLIGSTTLTGSFSVSGSTIQTGNNTLQGLTTLTGSISMSGSIGMVGSITASSDINIGGVLKLNPTTDPGNFNETSSYLFTSASNTVTGYDLYYRQQNNLVKFKWLEGGISTGLLYGGVISYSGSTIFVKPGSGIINNNNASTGSEISPIFTYVNWGPYTASATYLTSSQNTYLYVDASGNIFQQTSFFNQTQYEQAIPLGRVTHPNYISITGVGSNVQTTYDSDTQQNDFIRAFGPIKVSGFSINAHTGSLGLGIGDGIAYNLGGFYTQDPNSPSHYESNGFATASIARAWRSGSGVYLDNNGGSFYNAVDPDYWDDGTGTLNTMNAGDWQIQRVFANPVTGRTVVYYGQNVYTTLINALQYLATDSFTEGEFTAKSLVFVGYLVLKGQTNNLTDAANNRIINAGIFRNIAGGSAGGSAVVQRLENLADVVVTTPSNGQALVYDGGNWINSNPLSSSYALSASYSATATSSSYALTASSADNFLVRGTLTAQTINVQTITSSVDFVTGSTRFGTLSSNTHQFTGSVSISGSLAVTNGVVNSLTSSYAVNADLLDGLDSSTFVLTGSFGAQTASFNAFSASVLAYTASNNATITKLYAETASILSYTASAKIDSGSVSTRLVNLEAFSSSLDATFATDADLNALSSSFIAYTASLNNFSASMLSFTASQRNLNGTYATTGSNTFRGTETISGSLLISGSGTVVGFNSDTLEVTGSLIVAGTSSLSGLSSITGSLTISGSTTITGSISVSGSVINNLTASYAVNADLLDGLDSSTFVLTGSFGSQTASFNAFSASILNYTASNNTTISQLYAETASILAHTASINAFSASINAYTASNNTAITSLYSATASLNTFSASILNYTASNNAAIADILLETASFNNFSSSILSYTASNNAAITSLNLATASLSSSIAILSGSFLSASASFDTRINSLTESVFTHVVTSNGASNYIIDGVAKPMLSFVPGATYKFDTTAVGGSHPFRFSTSPNGPTQYTAGVISGSNYIQIEVNYDTPTLLYYYCTIHSGMGNEINVLRIENLVTTASFSNFSSSINAFSASILNYTSSTNAAIADILLETASFNAFSSSINSYTSSTNAAIADILLETASINLFSASLLSFTASQGNLNGTYATTGSNIFEGVQTINSNLVVTGSITAQTLVVQTITSSIDFVTGSTRFGSSLANTHQFTGSVSVTGSLAVNNSNVILTNQTSSMSVATASYWSGSITNALSSSFASTASYWSGSILNATSASFASTASYWSGSIINAQTASFVTLAQSASYWSGSIQNAVSAAFADLATSASFASTASYALNAGSGGGGGLSALYIQDEGITQGTASYIDFTGAGVTATVSNGTASVSITGGGSGTAVQGASVQYTQIVSATTWSINHAINSRTPVVEVYDSNYNVIIPTAIQNPAPYQTNIFFDVPQIGYAIISTGGVLSVSGSNAILNQTLSAATWSFNHELNNLYPVFTIFDSNDDVIIPQRIHVVDTGSAVIYFSSPRTGTAVASVSGNQTFALSSSLAATASLALTAISSSYAATASFVTLAQTASFVTTAQTASFVANAQTASFVTTAQTASFVANAQTASFANNFTVAGTLTAQTLVVQTVTSSVIYSSGSNKFGNDLANTQQLTGSVTITGSLAVNDSNVVLTNQTSSMSVATASFVTLAQTASFVTTAQTASFVTLAQTASFVQTAQTASFVTLAQSASFVTLAQSASYWSGSIQNATSASFATNANSSSYALTASFALNGGGGGISAISIADEGILLGSASYFDFTGAGVSTIVNAGTASFTISGGGSGTQGLTTTFTQSSAAVSWSFTHNLNTRTPVVQVYDSGYNQITPQYISSSNANEVVIGFGIPTTGYAVVSTGGALVVTGSNVILNQTASAATWSFNHGLNQQYPIFQVFNTDDEVIIPERIKAVDSASALIYFPTPVAGKAVASFAGLSGSIGGGSGAGFPFSGSAVITGSFLVSGSFVDFTQVNLFTGNLTGTASYATFALTASTAPGYTVQFSQSVAATTWSFTHNMGTRNPIVQVYDTNYKQIIPNDIVGIDGSTAQIRFDYAQAGYAVMSNGGGLYITGSTSTLIQTSAATTWSFNHRLNTKYPAFEVYDENDLVIIPAGIKAIDTDNAEIYFAGAQAGRAIANFSGINGLQDNAVSASYASSGSVFHVDKVVMDRSLMDYAQVNSSIVGSNNMFTQATGSYTAAFFKYTVASGSNARAGEVSAVWNGGTTEFMDVSTNDIGNTNAVTASVAIVSGEAQLNFQTNTSGWRIKSTATFI